MGLIFLALLIPGIIHGLIKAFITVDKLNDYVTAVGKLDMKRE